jgi:glycosyltransferase involved in cell wall biosynthesis
VTEQGAPGLGRPPSDEPPHPPGLTVELHYGGDLDAAAWGRMHALGHVPDALPYGLDRMAAHGTEVLVPRRARAPLPRPVRGVLRRLGGGVDWSYPTPPGSGDVVLAWDERVGVPLSWRLGARRPVVTGLIWATDRVLPPPARAATRAALRRAALVFSLSAAQVAPIAEVYGVARRRIAVVPFGVDVDFFTPPTGTVVDRDLLVSVGNDRDRDFPTVLTAFAQVRRSRPATRLTIVSRTVTGAEGLPGVTVVPELDHRALRELVSRAAATLTLTRPNLHVSGITAVLESLALGRPALASATAGMSDYAPPHGGVTLTAPGDADAAAAACLRLLADPEEADGLGAAGRTTVVRRFSTDTQAARLSELTTAAASGSTVA